MQIDVGARVVRLSVGELATFRNCARSAEGHGGSRWRAGVGQKWHTAIEERTKATVPDARFEIPLEAIWRHRDWTLIISGRIDQLVPTADGHRLIEIKSIRHALPDDYDLLEGRYPNYFAQAAIYVNLLRILPEYANQLIFGKLLFVDIDTGSIQIVPIGPEQEGLFEAQVKSLVPFLEDRRSAQARLRNIDLKPAFTELRDGQAEVITTLAKAKLEARTVLLEAPTGFGKTGIVLEHALREMQNGLYNRCIYLTSKSTGQLETTQQLRNMVGADVRYIQMRNRTEHRIESPKHTCTGDRRCEADLSQNWQEQQIRPETLFTNGTFDIEDAKLLGEASGICPYTLTKSCLPFAEIWIGDTNYVFSPASQSVFYEAYGFDPKTTLLIVDEAHNLPDRAADALSVAIDTGDFFFALEALTEARAPKRLLAIGRELIRSIENLPTKQPITQHSVYELMDLSEDFAKNLQELQIDWELLPPFALELVWRIPDLADRLAKPAHNWLFWCVKPGAFRATCLDASNWISDCIKPFGGSILMSATLSPVKSFRESCGLSASQTTIAVGHAPWRETAYNVALDLRVDTRFKKRQKHYETTARTVAALVAQSPGQPIAVFFASYQYVEDVTAYLDAIDPEIRVHVQPRGVDLRAQESFLEEGLLMADALFLILGSSYAEGIDLLGGRVQTAMIVGPALPEVNAIQTAKTEAHPSLNREEAFSAVYIIPAMRRIHQALGRIVRTPKHRARVLLHGKRYGDPIYREQLSPEYQSAIEIKTEAQLHEWLIN